MKLTIKQVEKAIRLPAKEWAGKCYSIACDIVAKKLVNGKAVYGHWLGPVHAKSIFCDASVAGFCRHGWILMDDGTIVDPTRWVFEAKKPYIYIGENDLYDRGGNQLRKAMTQPPPEYNESEPQKLLVLDKETRNFVEYKLFLFGSPTNPNIFSIGQMFWLANLSLNDLGDFAKSIYESLEECHMGALIPLDNRNEILERV